MRFILLSLSVCLLCSNTLASPPLSQPLKDARSSLIDIVNWKFQIDSTRSQMHLGKSKVFQATMESAGTDSRLNLHASGKVLK
jgi:hypothetical protein